MEATTRSPPRDLTFLPAMFESSIAYKIKKHVSNMFS